MVEVDIIREKRILFLLEELREARTLIAIRVKTRNLYYLTMITGIRVKNGIARFGIDCSRGFQPKEYEVEGLEIDFEFTGRDKLMYHFKASVLEVSGHDLWMRFPEFIERGQRRLDFRIEAPLGTRLYFQENGLSCSAEVASISLGGVRIIGGKGSHRNVILARGRSLNNLDLRFPKPDHSSVLIGEAQVKWTSHSSGRALETHALQYTGLDRKQRRILKEQILRIQREILRKRARMDF